MKKVLFVMAILLVASVAFAQQGTSIQNGGIPESWANFTGSGPNALGGPGLGRHDLKETGNGNVLGCETCHLPHTAPIASQTTAGTSGAEFLWAWKTVPTGVGTYITETNPSGSLTATGGRTGTVRSTLCLTCHDGTSAGANFTGQITFSTGAPYELIATGAGAAGFSTNLAGQHPVDAIFPNNGDYAQPSALLTTYGADAIIATVGSSGLVSLPLWSSASTAGVTMPTGTPVMECSTCHDPHNDYTTVGGPGVGGYPFLREGNTNGVTLCRECHNK